MAISAEASPDDRAPADSRPVQQGEAQLRPAGVTLSWLSLTQLHLDRRGHAWSSTQHESITTYIQKLVINTHAGMKEPFMCSVGERWGKPTKKKKVTSRKLISYLSLINYALEKANRVDDGKRNETLKEKWIFNTLPPSTLSPIPSLSFFLCAALQSHRSLQPQPILLAVTLLHSLF